MAILYYDEKKLFQLNTENTTYVIGLSPEGYVGHVYYGPLLHGEPDLYPLRMDEPPFTPSVNKREKSSFLDRFPMEYPCCCPFLLCFYKRKRYHPKCPREK